MASSPRTHAGARCEYAWGFILSNHHASASCWSLKVSQSYDCSSLNHLKKGPRNTRPLADSCAEIGLVLDTIGPGILSQQHYLMINDKSQQQNRGPKNTFPSRKLRLDSGTSGPL